MEDLKDDQENLIVDREILESYIENILSAHPDAADLLAHLFVKFKAAIVSRARSASQIEKTLTVAIELTYLQTRAHIAALELYNLYQRGELLIRDYPLDLINGAIERSRPCDQSESAFRIQAKGDRDSVE